MTSELFAADAMADPLLDLMGGFIQELRDAGLPVSLTENLDAMEAVRAISIEDRTTFKHALGATLVKNHQHWPAFETVFDVYFSIRGPEYSLTNDDDDPFGEGEGDDGQQNDQSEGSGSEAGGGGGDAMSNEDLAEMLYQALMRQDQNLQRAVARTAVQRFAGMEPGRPVGGTYYLYRTLRNLDLDGVLERMLEQDRQDNEGRSGLDDRLAKDEYESRIEKLKTEIEAEIRRRLVADRGVEAMAKTLRKPLPEDLDFMHATRDEMETLRKAIAPLTRKLAIRLARKRRHLNKGGLDFRTTIRKSLSYGGVPAEPRFKHPRPSKPEIVILADISGSVAAFARFTLHLVYAMSGQFSKVRAFVFIDGLDEVTDFFDGHEDITAAVHRVIAAAYASKVSSLVANSLVAFSISERYLSKIFAVSVAVSASTCSTPSSTNVRAQSMVSDTEGALRKSSWRTLRTMRATWSAKFSEISGTLVNTISRSRSSSG